jgi:hypothetical protein
MSGARQVCELRPEDLVANQQLPERTVTLTLGQLKRFRADFAWLMQFAADVCGTTPERLCIWDVEKFRYQHGLPMRDPLMRHLAEQADQQRQDQPPAPDEPPPVQVEAGPPRLRLV